MARVYSAAARVYLDEAESCRKKLMEASLGVDSQPSSSSHRPASCGAQNCVISASGEMSLRIGDLLRPRTSHAASSTVGVSRRADRDRAVAVRDRSASRADAPLPSGRAPVSHERIGGVAAGKLPPRSGSAANRRRPLSVGDIIRRRNQATPPVAASRASTSMGSRPSTADPVQQMEQAMFGWMSTPSGANVLTLDLGDVGDHAADIFDVNGEENSETDSGADDTANDVSSAVISPVAADEVPNNLRLLDSRPPLSASDERKRKLESKANLNRMKLEVERYELEQELTTLIRARQALEDDKRAAQATRESLRSRQAKGLAEASRCDAVVDLELGEEWAKYRAKLDAERRALRLRENPEADSNRKQFYQPKHRSPWSALTMNAGELPHSRYHVCASTASDASSRRTEKGVSVHNSDISEHQREEVLRMRQLELRRHEETVEPSSRTSIEGWERHARQALTDLWHEGLLHECAKRKRITTEESIERASLTRHAAALHQRQQIRDWMPDVFADKAHMERRLLSAVVPAEEQKARLEAATEAHRVEVRRQWARALQLREEVLSSQRKRMTLKDELRQRQREFRTIFGDGNAEDPDLSSLPAPLRVAACKLQSDRILRVQRIEMLQLQIRTLEDGEAHLREEIERCSSYVW